MSGRRLLSLGRAARHRTVDGAAQPAPGAGPGPAPPAGPGDDVRGVQGPAGRGRPAVEVMDLDSSSGRFCVAGVKRGDFIIGHGLDESRRPPAPPGRRHRPGRAPAAALQLMAATAPTVRSLHRHLGRRPRRRRHRRLPALPGLPLPRRVRRLGRRLREPLRRPPGAHGPTATGTPSAAWPRHESDGIVAEVLFPNTVPPFFEQGNLVALPPSPEDYERRWAGVQAHNRWLADFCAAAPGRRAGIVQVFVNDIDDAVAEIRWAKEAFDGPFGGILLPSIPPNSHLPPLWDDHYEPLWQLCDELDVPHQHPRRQCAPRLRRARGGPGHHADRDPVVQPPIRVAPHLRRGPRAPPDAALRRDRAGRGLAAPWARDARLVLRPHDPGQRGRSQLLRRRRRQADDEAVRVLRPQLLDRRLLPAPERGAALPRARDRPGHVGRRLPALRGELSLHDRGPAGRLRRLPRAATSTPWSSRTPPSLYGFDLEALRPIGDRIGPPVADVATPLARDDWPTKTTCNAFDPTQILRAW